MKTEIARLTRRAGLGAVTVLAAALALGSTVTAISPRAQAVAPPSARAVMPLPILASARIDPAAIGRLYNDAIVSDGNIDRVIAALTAATHDVSRPKRYRANASLVRAHLQWRHGRLPLALTAIDEGLAIEAYDDLVYFKARALDASGKTDQARDGYQQALALTTSPKLRESIRLRLTIADAVDQNVQGLTALAKASPRDFRNRAAITLGILDFSKEAADLYEVSPQGPEAFREHLRVAQWAVKAGDARRAQDEAWQAVQAATLDRDRKYSLSLLVEAHTLDKSLDALLDRLARQPALTPDEESLRIDLLRQTGKYAQAISLFKSAHAGELSIDLRQELLRIYRDAGQDAAMIAEYQHLIATEPAATAWPEGLGQYYLEQADPANARRVWADFLDRNTDVDTLLAGSESMTSFGLHDLALAAADKALAQTGAPETAARIRLAQFELFRHRGLNGEAEATLGALDALLAPDSPYRTELADAYERLQKPQLAAKTLEAFSKSKGGLGVDEKMRLAWLLDSIGRRDDALQLWHEMWSTETLASRRRLIEDRLLLLAAELGSLGDLAVDLEEKLAKGTAAPQDVSLLVDIYTKVGDSVSAIEVVTSAAAQHGKTTESEVASLKEQAQIYLALSEYGDFARVTRRLVDLDPANKVDYLQSLLLNQIEAGSDGGQSPQDATAQLNDYLGKLRQAGGEAVGAEFEAGVLDLAGFRDRAIDAYRRALALHPERADDHLLLADLLRQAGRQAEAVASLQYLAEDAADTDELFLITIDGITNMRTGNVATIRWAERRALERLTARDDRIYLYDLLADLAEEAKDVKTYLSALENSLAHADSQRSHVLRQLLAATAEVTTYEAGQRAVKPDAALNVLYARRLISLGEELPPDVYIDLGRTFIKMADPASAMRAFDLAVDRTGRTSVVLDAAKLFERGGYDREAIREYERALIANSGSIETMFRLAELRARTGAAAPANDLYLRALLAVVSQQTRAVDKGPDGPPPVIDAVVTFDYRRYFQMLVTGFESTLPSGRDDRARALHALEDALNVELAQVPAPAGATGPDALTGYPRLSVLAETLRTVAFSAGVREPADRADAALLRRFGRDADLATRVVADRARWGFSPPAGFPRPAPTATAAPERDSADYIRDVGLAMAKDDQDAALTVYRQWAKFAGLPKPPLRLGTLTIADRSPGLVDVASHAWQRLDERHFGSLAQYIQGLIADQDAYAGKVILNLSYQYETTDVPILTRIEAIAGRPLIAEDRLMRLVNAAEWNTLNFQYVFGHLSPEHQIELLSRALKGPDIVWSYVLTSLGVILSKPMDPPHAAELLAMLKPAMQSGFKGLSGMSVLANFMNYSFTSTVVESNAPILLELEQFIADKHPDVFKVGYFKAGLLRDLHHDREALAAFVDAALQMYVPPLAEGASLAAGQPSPYAYQSYVRSWAPFIFPAYKADVMALLDEKERGPAGLTEALISLRIELNNSDPSSDSRQILSMLQAMADRHPASEQILNTLYPLYDQWGYTAKAIDVLTQLTALRPDNRNYRYRLVTLWQKVERPEKAAEAAGANTLDDLAPVVARNYYIEALSQPAVVRFPALKRAADAIKAFKTGGDQAPAAQGLRALLRTLPPPGMSLSEYFQTRDDDDPDLYLRDLLLLDGEVPPPAAPAAASPAGAAAPATPAAPAAAANTYDRLVTSLESTTGPAAGAARAAKVMDVVVRHPFAAAELESYLDAMRAEDIDKQYIFYTYLVDAYVNNGRADDELQRRTADVEAGTAGLKDVTVWLGLASRQPAARAEALLQAADRGGVLRQPLGALGRVLLARLCVTAGRRDQALEAYTAVATSLLAGLAGTLQPNTLAVDAYGRDQGLMLFTGLGLFDEVRGQLDPAAVTQFVATLLGLSKPAASASVEQAYARFVTVLYLRAEQAGLSIPPLEQAVAALRPTRGYQRSDTLRTVYARARLGRIDEALDLLQTTLQRDLETRDPITAAQSNLNFASRQYQIALGLSGDPQALGPFGTTGAAIEEFKPLFPSHADAWPGAGAWVARVARELPLWISGHAINRDAGLQLLSLVTLRSSQSGDAQATEAAARSLADVLQGGPVSLKAATLAVAVADKVGTPIDLPLLQALVRANGLHVSRVIGVIARTAQVDGPARALDLGAAAAAFSSNDDLIKQLIAIAQSAGNAAEVQRWTARQQEVIAARAKLTRKAGKGE